MKDFYTKEDTLLALNSRMKNLEVSYKKTALKNLKKDVVNKFFRTKTSLIDNSEWNEMLAKIDKELVDFYLSIHA